jgi:hypothetical protein
MNNLEKDFTLYPEAFGLKQLGFDEPCLTYIYTGDTGNNCNVPCAVLPSKTKNFNEDDLCVSTPTYSQAFRWFRYNYWYYASISPSIDIGNVDFTVEVSQFFQEDRYVGEGDDQEYFPWGLQLVHTERFDTYEEAELACLRKLIETANEQQIRKIP